MRRFFVSLAIFLCGLVISSAEAKDILSIPYKNIKESAKVKFSDGIWSTKVDKKDFDYFVKFISDGTGSYSEFFKSSGAFAFTTGCQYEFIYNGSLIGYSNQDLKFYEFMYIDGELTKRALADDEINELFPDFEIIKISEFSPNTNSLKIKKTRKNFKIIIFNDTDKNFYHYSFTSGNAKFKTYPLAGFINVTKKGMIQFSHFGDNTDNNPWFVLLIR